MKRIYKTQNSVSITKCPYRKNIMIGSHDCGDCDSYVDHRNESPCIGGYVICRMKTGEAIEKLSMVDKSSKLRNFLYGDTVGDLLEFLFERKESHGEKAFVYKDIEEEVELLLAKEN